MLRKGIGFLLPSGTLEKNRMISHDRKSHEWVKKFGGRGKLNINGQIKVITNKQNQSTTGKL